MIGTKIVEKAGTSLARKRVGMSQFKTAYKANPGQTIGKYVGQHKAGLAVQGGITTAAFLPAPYHRQSTHKGIDRK